MFLGFVGALLGAVLGHLFPKLVDFWFEGGIALERNRNEACEEIRVSIDVIVESCENYWPQFGTDDPDARVLEARIMANLQSIQLVLPGLFDTGSVQLKNSRDEWKALHEVSTGGHFGDPERKPDGNRLAAILQDATSLKRGIVARRRKLKRKLF